MIKDLGYLDELQKQFEDPVTHFKEVARHMTEEKNCAKETIQVLIPLHDTLAKLPSVPPDKLGRKNIGYAALSVLYHQLGIDSFLNNRRRSKKFEANLNSIFKLLVFNRALFPASKKGAWEHRGLFFEDTTYSLEAVYRSPDYFLQWRPVLLKHLHRQMQEKYGRDTLLLYYDVTNYYFEIDGPDALRKKGVSKEHRPNSIVQMGLFMDEKGLPVSYELYQGNANLRSLPLHFMRLLEFRLDWRHSASAIQYALSHAAGTRLEDNLYVFDYYDDVLEAIGKNLGIDFSAKYLSAQQIRSLIGSTKKT